MFCIRILLLRCSDSQLRSFWPIVQNELIGLLSSDQSVPVRAAVCRLLDLAALLPFEPHKIQGAWELTNRVGIRQQSRSALGISALSREGVPCATTLGCLQSDETAQAPHFGLPELPGGTVMSRPDGISSFGVYSTITLSTEAPSRTRHVPHSGLDSL